MCEAKSKDEVKDKALESFIWTINATGGVIEFRDGTVAPEADPEWIDLGDAYLTACRALGKTPLSRPATESENSGL